MAGLPCPDHYSLPCLLAFVTSDCVAWQVRLVNLVKKAVMPYKNHRGKVKSIAVIDPGELHLPRTSRQCYPLSDSEAWCVPALHSSLKGDRACLEACLAAMSCRDAERAIHAELASAVQQSSCQQVRTGQ